MKTDKLKKAREYESRQGAKIPAGERPVFHLTPQVGWMNDPNGLCMYQGRFHIFYQYNPYDTHWSDMHWGHAVSDDLLTWENLPAALAPDKSYDKNGCFSGGAVELSDGRHLLLYTGVEERENEDGTKETFQTQNVAIGDGVDYEKFEANPVMDASLLPEGASTVDFRDPKLWRENDGSFRCVLGSRPSDGSGQILLYESDDAISWRFVSILAKNRNRFGKMWECPDFFKLDGKYVILTSPQDMLPMDMEYHNGNGNLCLIGSLDEKTKTFVEESDHAIDYGIDFYATQTIEMPDGRRVMIGWLKNWDACMESTHEKWNSQLSIPRELSIHGDRLYQWPIRELDAHRANPIEHKGVLIDGEKKLSGISGRVVDMELLIDAFDQKKVFYEFEMRIAENDDYHTSIFFRPRDRVIKLDRKFSGSRRAVVHQRRCLIADGAATSGKLSLRIIMDRYSVEVFINDGMQVMSMEIDTELSAEGISFRSDGDALLNIKKYDLI